jgi:hypothetical protein
MDVAAFPDGAAEHGLNGGIVARLRFVRDISIAADPLFTAVSQRRSTKEPYDLARGLTPELLARLAEEGEPSARISGTAEPARIATIRRLVLDAGEIEGRTERTHLESVRLMRLGHREIDASPDGIDLGGPMIEALRLTGQIDRASLANPASQAYQIGMESQRETYGSIPAALWIITPGNTRVDQLAAGRAYVRANLKATLLGLAMHPRVSHFRSSPRCASNSTERTISWHPEGGRVQMLARVGIWSSGAAEPAVAARNQACASMSEDPLAFRVFNEIGIIEQLSRNLFERVLPDGLTLPQFTVLNHFVRWVASDRLQGSRGLPGYEADHDEHAGAARTGRSRQHPA